MSQITSISNTIDGHWSAFKFYANDFRTKDFKPFYVKLVSQKYIILIYYSKLGAVR